MDESDEPRADAVPLDERRRLTAEERELLEHLAGAPLAKEGLGGQIEAAWVVAECSCGCPSVWLEVDASAPSVSFDEAETPDGRTDHVSLAAREQSETGFPEVTLHVVQGRLFELEVWAGYGVRPRVNISDLEYV